MEKEIHSISENKMRVLVADSDAATLGVLENALVSLGYNVIIAHNSPETLEQASLAPDLIILGNHLSDASIAGIVLPIKKNEQNRAVPVVLAVSAQSGASNLNVLPDWVDDFVTLPLDKIELSITISSLLVVSQAGQLLSYREQIKAGVAQRAESVNEPSSSKSALSLKRIYGLSRVAEFRDEEAHGHIERISHYSTAIARNMGQNEEFLQNILFAAPLHDVGEIATPDAVLQKSGKLNEKEWEIMQRHSPFGAELLQKFETEFLEMAEDITATHHERWDGTGYPSGLKGDEIPLAGRIVAIADVFDVLTWERPYRQPVPLEEAFDIIREGRGSHFDPAVVDAFFAIRDEITQEYNWWKFMG